MSRVSTATLREALFTSDLQPSQHPEPQQVRAAIRRTIWTLGVQDCAASVAQEFGDRPDTAVARMRWAKAAVAEAYQDGVYEQVEDTRRIVRQPTATAQIAVR